MTGFKQKVFKAALWLTGLNMASQAVTWLATLFVIRLLHPADYGLYAMASVFMGLLITLNEVGLGAAIVQKAEEATRIELKKVAGFVLIVNVLLATALVLTAPLAAAYFKEARLVLILRTLSINFLLLPFYFVPRAMLVRELNFKRKSLVDLISNFGSSIIVILLALSGMGVWALVFALIGANAIRTIGFNLASPKGRCLPVFSVKGIQKMLTFGGFMLLTRFLWYFYSQADMMVGGRLFDVSILGVYAVAIQIVSMPLSKITPLVSQIGFPAFSRIQENLKIIQENFLKLARIINTFSFPAYIGLTIVAAEAVPLVLGNKWASAVLPVRILCLIMPLRFIAAIYAPIVSGIGKPNVITGNMVFAIVIMPIAFIVGARWGIIGFCYAWLLAFPILFAIMSQRCLKVLQLNWNPFLKTFIAPAAGSLIMSLVVYGLKRALQDRLPSSALLILLILSGACTYVVSVAACDKKLIGEIKRVVFAR